MLFPLYLVLASALAAPMVEEHHQKKTVQPLTVEAFDGYVGLLNMFKDMLPKNLMDTINNLNTTQKGELVSFITDWFQDKISKPIDKTAVVELIKDKLPSVYEKIQGLNNTFYEKFNALKPETQTMLRSWKEKAMAVDGATPAETAGKELQLLKEFGQAIQNLDSETKEDLRKQFPTAVRLTEGLGFTVVTTIAMIFQKIAETLTPVPTIAPQGIEEPNKVIMQECPIH